MQLMALDTDAVSRLAAAYPDRDEWRDRISYVDGKLNVPDDLAAKVAAIDQAAALKVDLKGYAAGRRATVLNQSIAVPGGRCWVDQGTRTDLDQTARAITQGLLTAPVPFKLPSGFVSLTVDQLNTIIATVARFVAQAFAAEAALGAQIDAGSVTSRAQIDAAAWPNAG